ncbi:type II toxin-antitoxin system VapC family toxin [Cohnella herbarum]|uniref:Type II toxin-antitoxin system VapC family toxin n=1 Tax=Cohnella herbarum TaxID=2728023 RepID=A0A7Z2VLE5_9BACL|nr:type II toxin-antitoxin system VapC family toxin [Cohnella herbarum]QJD84945.1 type II toxin-antitoxin system VapC family toxin [Cohnella herbarum]
MSRVILDASIWVKILTEEPGTDSAQELVVRLLREKKEIVAPAIMKLEVGSVLRKKWRRKLLDFETLQELWNKFNLLPITYVDLAMLNDSAWKIADQNGLVHLYDAIYLALCDGIEFWTADERLVNSVKESGLYIRLLGEK